MAKAKGNWSYWTDVGQSNGDITHEKHEAGCDTFFYIQPKPELLLTFNQRVLWSLNPATCGIHNLDPGLWSCILYRSDKKRHAHPSVQ